MYKQVRKESIMGQITRPLCAIILCTALTLPGTSLAFAKAPVVSDTKAADSKAIPAEQLDALVAPIALYPDNLLAQVLVATTYPLELVHLHQWLQKNPELAKDQKKLKEAVEKETWDASIKSMASLPDVVKWLAEDVEWTTDLGNAFLAQQKDVMDAVQRMRAKAQEKGTLVSNDKMKVETQTVESKQVIVIEQSNPEVLYVPSYDPFYAYGDIGYPYPPIYYPPYYGTGAYLAAGAIGFGFGMMVGAAWGGWGCGWGGGDIYVDHHNNFNRNTNISGGDRTNNFGNRNQVNPLGDRGGLGDRGQAGLGNRSTWSHDPSHRGGTPYGDRKTADRFGGSTRGDSIAKRQSGARDQLGRQGGQLSSARRSGGTGGFDGRGNAPGMSDRASGLGDRGGNGFGNGSGLGNKSSLGSGNGNRMKSSRGSSSFGGSRGGGFSRGGGGMRGGGRRR